MRATFRDENKMVVLRGESLRCKVKRLLQKKQSGLGIRVQSNLIKQ